MLMFQFHVVDEQNKLCKHIRGGAVIVVWTDEERMDPRIVECA